MAISSAAPFPTSDEVAPPMPRTGPSPEGDLPATDHRDTARRPELLDRVVQCAHEAIDRLADSATPHLQRLQQGVASASDAAHARADETKELGDEWVESLCGTVREHPLAALATALAAGLLIDRLAQR